MDGVDRVRSAAAGTVAEYRIERRTGGGEFATIDSVPGGTLSYQDTGVSPGTTYVYRLRACNDLGLFRLLQRGGATTPPPPAGASTTQPNANAIGVSTTAVQESWTSPGGQTAYRRRLRP